MKRVGQACTLIAVLMVLAAGCRSTEPEPKVAYSPVAIESFQMVAGKWAGVMIRSPRSREEDWIRVTIGPDGQYEFASYRTIGVLSGRGQFTLADGKLTVTTERGTATGTLWTAEGRRMMRFVGALQDGMQYTSELTPAK